MRKAERISSSGSAGGGKPRIAFFVSACLFLFGCSLPDGGEIFRREGCGVCHRFGGGEGDGRVDLAGVADRRSDAWLREQLRYPRIHKRDSGMPSFAHLSGREIEALIHYLKERDK